MNGPASRLCIAAPISSNAVLQRAPAAAAVTGSVPPGYGDAPMTIEVVLRDENGPFEATASSLIRPDLTWKVLLPPRPAFGNYSLSARCAAGCQGDNATAAVTLLNLTFGDVFICAGQSNMQLMLEYTFERNASIERVRRGSYDNIRLFYGPMNFDYATNQTDVWVINADQAGDPVQSFNKLSTGGWRSPRNLIDPIPDGHNTPPWYLSTEFSRFYATCWYTFEALTDAMLAAGTTPPPFGLVAVAVGGTKIAQWVEWGAQASCRNVTCCDTHDCTQSPTSNPDPYQPITHANCSGNAGLYNGLIAPLVNTTVAGWLWYQGENSLPYDAGNYADGTGYGCMMAKLIESWRAVWSVEPGTTDALAPFGLVGLADGTDEGFGGNMRQFRWAQTANYGVVPNPAMPRTFMAEAHDLGDPWHTPICTTGSGTFNGAAFVGTGCCVERSLPLSTHCTQGDHRGEFALNSTRDWAHLGPLHPRLKRPVGERLARGLHALAYNGTGIRQGPSFVGCSVAPDGRSLVIGFNASLLAGERVLFSDSNTILREDTALYVLVNGSADTGPAFMQRMRANHHDWDTTWGAPRYRGPYTDGSEMGLRGWVAVAAVAGPTSSSLRVDLSHLPDGARVAAIRYAAGAGGYNSTTGERVFFGLGSSRMCCGPTVDTALQPCAPASCPIKASGPGSLPASPFFAAVDAAGHCACFEPQRCGGVAV